MEMTNMDIKTVVVIFALVGSIGTVGALSYTTADVTRSATIDMDTDMDAIIGVEPGVVGTLNGGDQISFDFDNVNALNTDAQFTFGDAANSANSHAFSVTNNDGDDHRFSFEYTSSGDGVTGTPNVNFEVFDDAGNSMGTFSEETGAATELNTDTPAGGTVYVVVTIDTTGQSSADDLSGDLSISA